MNAEPLPSDASAAAREPQLALAPAASLRPWRRAQFVARTAALSALCAWGAGVVVPNVLDYPLRGTVTAILALIAALAVVVASCAGVVTLIQFRRASVKPSRGEHIGMWILTTFFGLLFVFLGAMAALIATMGFSRGRQLRRFGKVLLPDVEPGDTWNDLPSEVEVPAELRVPLAAQWRENGRTEHASVAAFARLTLDLMALGAPPRLLQDAQRDAQDEIRHAELCFSLARGLDGKAERPAAFPQASRARTLSRIRTLALAQLAVNSLVDGALHEGVSARIIAKLAQRCEQPQVRGVLKTLAADEGRHCAHGWDVVEWCLDEGGAPVAHALQGALRTLPTTFHTDLPEGAAEGGWERLGGIHSHALEAEEYVKARAELVRRVERLCTAPLSRAA